LPGAGIRIPPNPHLQDNHEIYKIRPDSDPKVSFAVKKGCFPCYDDYPPCLTNIVACHYQQFLGER
jgi:hypothetical protein